MGYSSFITGHPSFAVSVLVWGWEKKEKETNPGFGKYCVPLPYILRAPVELLQMMILATTKVVFECQGISLDFEKIH